jgi:general stress protein 26
MRQIELDYEEQKQNFIEELGKLGSEGLYQRGILATSEDGHVTARRMRIIADGLKLYFVTDRGTRKCDQILANPNVAVVAGFVQIEGVASLKGHPFDEPDFIKAYKATQPDFYEKWRSGTNVTRERDLVVIEISPNRIALFKYGDPASGTERGIYVLNVAKKEAHRLVDFISVESRPSGAPAYKE